MNIQCVVLLLFLHASMCVCVLQYTGVLPRCLIKLLMFDFCPEYHAHNPWVLHCKIIPSKTLFITTVLAGLAQSFGFEKERTSSSQSFQFSHL